jgi:adenylate kinase family enzyme
MTPPRVHVTGASGTGTTTLGRALAAHWGVPHLDTDHYYWVATDPPFTRPRPVAERLALIAADQGTGGWVLSGSADVWGDPAIRDAGLVVFLTAPKALRLARLRAREAAMFGDRIGPGGDMERIHQEFMDWAACYDDPYFPRRSLVRHRAWLARLSQPVIELDGARPVAELTGQVVAALG